MALVKASAARTLEGDVLPLLECHPLSNIEKKDYSWKFERRKLRTRDVIPSLRRVPLSNINDQHCSNRISSDDKSIRCDIGTGRMACSNPCVMTCV